MKEPKNLFDLKIGVLGGGQLARMLAAAGAEAGYNLYVLSEKPDDPAAQVSGRWQQGSINEAETLERFFRAMDIVTVESEFLDTDLVQSIEKKLNRKVLRPFTEQIALFSDRASQKKWLVQNQIPTPPFIVPESEAHLSDFFARHKKGIVIKKRRFGYDGYGTFILRDSKSFKKWLGENTDENTYQQFIAEAFVPFRRELAAQLAMNERGQCMVFPIVEWKAQDSKCLWVNGPVAVDSQTQAVIAGIRRSLKKLNYVGAIAFEFFEGAQGLLVNEVAPRVHNSGHHSLESCVVSQFQAHLLAIANQRLAPEAGLRSKGFAMLNLIGKHDRRCTMNESPYGLSQPAALHWYGKSTNRPGRKMGHITAIDTQPKKALNQVLKMRKYFKI